MASSGRITLTEIARRAETSPMAVSVVLNGARSNTRVSDTTRRRIKAIAAEVNYTPNAMARSLKNQRTHTLGVLFNWAGTHTLHNLYSVAVLDGIVAAAAEAGYHILIYTESWRSTALSARTFADQRTDGVIVVAPNEHSDVVPGLASLGLKVTVLSSVTTVEGVPYVAIDNQSGVTAALEHLRGLGHTRIAFAGQGRQRVSMRERYDTYLAWMREHGFPVYDGYANDDFTAGGGGASAERWKQLLQMPNRPTAVFTVTDDLAAEALDTARSLGIAVPDQLSVVGFDDVLIASLTVPKLTTIRLPLFEMGKQSARLLIENIEGRGDTDNPAHIVAPELVVRASTKAAAETSLPFHQP